MTDPIADMLTRIRNAQQIRKAEVDVPYSKLKLKLLEILSAESYISGFEKVGDNHPLLRVKLKYEGKESAIRSIKRESKPGHRVYCKAGEMPRILNDYGIAVVSTSKGLMTNKEARKQGIGGEIICSIY